MISNRIENSIELGRWIATKYESLEVVGDGRVELAATCYYITCQHQKAIAHLFCLGLFAPATALIRCTWDSFTRGMWLNFAATASQLDAFKKNEKPPPIKDLLTAVDKVLSEPGSGFLKAHESKYSRLCDFNHTGIVQISNHFLEKEIVSQLADQSIDEVLRFVEGMALSALCHMALLGSNQVVAQQAFDRLHEMNLPSKKHSHD